MMDVNAAVLRAAEEAKYSPLKGPLTALIQDETGHMCWIHR